MKQALVYGSLSFFILLIVIISPHYAAANYNGVNSCKPGSILVHHNTFGDICVSEDAAKKWQDDNTATIISNQTSTANVPSQNLQSNTTVTNFTNPQADLEKYKAADVVASQHIQTFDNLDFDVFTNQKWDRLKESHSADVIVHWPDGHQTRGIEQHIEDLKAMFVYAPDTRIQEHPVKIASGEWTSVIGVMEGTFTKPMPTADGKTIPPTGKAFKLVMCTVGHWKNGVMDEEYLFWDNQSFMKQIGLS